MLVKIFSFSRFSLTKTCADMILEQLSAPSRLYTRKTQGFHSQMLLRDEFLHEVTNVGV